ncbi:hypothetical protein E3P92_01508 [Wallemia ichthyophaga]|uniref:GP-PDE domain-containing protein n=1 Tax=Wallemia ichthyophaga TaxID=245174 RepID=A0A4T0HDJ7_WALIC|nr:hypothetical protein E3P98_01359 [Wallemia ichthyophaga]TIA91886.1 hypothetical protein E3P97_01747 [Wallemia ichthyophaga]TIB00910.1 hypothetical protein E3P95_01455 [Wallemia ichthyophaga]TIB01842.1 hypothetical protein E3P94_01587 [Wallemia ichthyophaga]TIB02098.1 hypothetical protein E3P96_02233 [Wallemia ichthyophaga]
MFLCNKHFAYVTKPTFSRLQHQKNPLRHTLFAVSALMVALTASPVRPPLDIQAHRGGRGSTVENTLPSFAYGAISGANTLELDFGVTKDGYGVVWHDEYVMPSKCLDTAPVVEEDSMWPYVGKHIANLTLAQIKTLDCGSLRQSDFPIQETYPGTKLSTLDELFEFVACFDKSGDIQFNVETKINAARTNSTRDPLTFVEVLLDSIDKHHLGTRITHQSFDWRALQISKHLRPHLKTSALYDVTTATNNSAWLGDGDITGIEDYNGLPPATAAALIAREIDSDMISPAEITTNSSSTLSSPEYHPFLTEEVVHVAHDLDMLVKPWTVDTLNVVDEMYGWGVDGIITDWPHQLVRWAELNKLNTARKFDHHVVNQCLAEHNQLV